MVDLRNEVNRSSAQITAGPTPDGPAQFEGVAGNAKMASLCVVADSSFEKDINLANNNLAQLHTVL